MRKWGSGRAIAVRMEEEGAVDPQTDSRVSVSPIVFQKILHIPEKALQL